MPAIAAEAGVAVERIYRAFRQPDRTVPDGGLEGNICAFLAAKDHVNVFLYDGGIVPDPEGIITAGHDNQTARTIGFREHEQINERALATMFRLIIANNRVGGWRRLKGPR